MRCIPIAASFAVLLLPCAAAAQGVAAAPPVDPDDLGMLVQLVVDGLRGGDWQLAAISVVLAVVWVVRRIATRVPHVGAFVGTDEGGTLLAFLTAVPLALLGFKMAGATLTLALAGKGLVAGFGAIGAWSGVRRLLRLAIPLVDRLPRVGPWLARVLVFIAGKDPRTEVSAGTEAAYAPLNPPPDAGDADAVLFRPPPK